MTQSHLLALATEIDGDKDTQIVAIESASGYFIGTVNVAYRGKRSVCICGLFVHPSHRKNGVGRKLIEQCCVIAKEAGCETIGLLLNKGNESSLFYEKVGFNFGYQYDDESILMLRRF